MKFLLKSVCICLLIGVLSSCNQIYNTQGAALVIPIKDVGLSTHHLKVFNKAPIPDSTMVFNTYISRIEDDILEIDTAVIKGANYIEAGKVLFRVVAVDYNQNSFFDDEDAIFLAGAKQDSVLFSFSPLKVIGKNPVYIKYDREVIKVQIDARFSTIQFTKTPSIDYHDLVFPDRIPNIPVTDLISGKTQVLDELYKIDKHVLVVRTAPYCKPCIKSYRKYVELSKQQKTDLRFTKKIFFFPEDTDISNIENYTKIIPPNDDIIFVKGDLKKIDEVFGLVAVPDGILLESDGRFIRNHATLSALLQE